MDTKTILNDASGRMQKAIDHLEEELLNVRAGKASPNALNGVMVDYFGSQVPVSGAASVTVPDAKTILIQPWDKNMLRAIEKAIIDSNIGLTPSNNGEQIRLSIPPLTEERRKELVKQIRNEAETARISLRNARRDAVEAFKKAQKEGMPEDESKDGEAQAQKLLEKFTKTLDEALQKKEKGDHDGIKPSSILLKSGPAQYVGRIFFISFVRCNDPPAKTSASGSVSWHACSHSSARSRHPQDMSSLNVPMPGGW